MLYRGSTVPDLYTLGMFSLACLALTSAPGPDMLLVATRSATQGKMAGLATYLGIAMGSYCHALALAFGLSTLFLAVPFAYDAVRIAGALYLLYLAWQAFTSNDVISLRKDKSDSYSNWIMFRQGMISNILNPKIALFFLALFPQFLNPESGSLVLQILVLATTLNVIGFCVKGTVILISSNAKSALTASPSARRISRYITGVVFTGLAARLAFDNQR